MKTNKIIAIIISLIICLSTLMPTTVLAVNEIENITKSNIENNIVNEEKEEDNQEESKNDETKIDDNINTNETTENIIDTENSTKDEIVENEENSIVDENINEKKNTKEDIVENIVKDNDEEIKSTMVTTENTNFGTSLSVSYRTHVQDEGWQEYVQDGQMSGTSGRSLRLEGINIKLLNNTNTNINIKYQVHVQDIGWQEWKKNDEMAGTSGRSLRLEGIRISLENTQDYSIMYRVHVQDIGWQEWKYNGEMAGTSGRSLRLEGIEIKIIKNPKIEVNYTYNEDKNTVTATITSEKEIASINDSSWKISSDKKTYTKTFNRNCNYQVVLTDVDKITFKQNIKVTEIIDNKVNYSSYIEGIGWEKQLEKIDGKTSGTVGQSKRLEAIKISLGNAEEITGKSNIKYQVHMQDYGWMDMKQNGEIAGVIGEEKRLEAIKIYLENVTGYTVIYRANVQDIGWTEWKNNGETAGTTGQDLRLEAIEIKIVKTPNIKVSYSYNADSNKVTATITSNKQLTNIDDTSWKLSTDKKTYTKTFEKNCDYQIGLTDVDGITVKNNIKVTQIMNSTVRYSSHVQDHGWMNWVKDSALSGTTGESKRVEAIKIDLGNSEIIPDNAVIKYQVHAQDHGWMDWKQNGQIAGTQGESKRIEAIRIKLEGIEGYSVRYRVHVQDYGWTDWRYNGAIAGTIGESKRVEAIQIEITKYTPKQSNFEQLDDSKYPGYKSLLRQLQSEHPDWILTIKYTGIDWNTAVENEYGFSSGSPRSLTQAPYLNEWKSAEDNNKYDVSQTWYRASRSAIAYMMDPRNSLEEAWIFQFQDLSSSAGTRQNIEKMVAGTFLNKASIIDTILSVAREQGISPFHLVSRMLQEQYRDGSGVMNGYTYNGRIVYNLFNINVSGNSSAGIEAGAKYAYDRHWFTPETCIIGSAEFLKRNYISKGQSTLYFQKYNVVYAPLYDHQYMQNIRAANDEGNTIYKSYRDSGLLDSQFEFVIPVYENMPSTACSRPKT